MIILAAKSMLFDLRLIRRRLAEDSTAIYPVNLDWALERLDDMIGDIENASYLIPEDCPAQEACVGPAFDERHSHSACSDG